MQRSSPSKMAKIDLAARGNVNSEERRPVCSIVHSIIYSTFVVTILKGGDDFDEDDI